MLSRPIYWPQSKRRWLVCLDLQRDYVIPGRPRYAAGNAEVAAVCARMLELARHEQWRIVHSQVRDEAPAAPWPCERFKAPIEGLRPLITEPVFFRRGLSAFANPGFTDELRGARGAEVFLIGFSLADTCLATAIVGHDNGAVFTLIEDAIGVGDSADDAAAARTLLRRHAQLLTSRDVMASRMETTP